MTQQFAIVAKVANSILGCTKRSIASRSREVILPLCSTLVKAHFECCVLCGAPRYERDVRLF